MSKIKCIDVSSWQQKIDWKKVKADGYEYVILRAGVGDLSSQEDDYFEINYKNAKAVGIKLGCYWFSYLGDDGQVEDFVEDAKLEAKACLSVIKGKTFELPIYYDLEWETIKEKSKSTITKAACAFCDAIKAGGYRPGVYCSSSFFDTFLDYNTIFSKYSVWIADWSDGHSKKCDIWQYADDGHVNGISGNVDMDYIENEKVIGSSSVPTTTTTKTKMSADDIIAALVAHLKTQLGNTLRDRNYCAEMGVAVCFWCVVFGQIMFEDLGIRDLIYNKWALNVGADLIDGFAKRGRLLSREEEPKVGDLMIITNSPGSVSDTLKGYGIVGPELDHFVFVVSVEKNDEAHGFIVTGIGGNQGDGGNWDTVVALTDWPFERQACYLRPDYEHAEPDIPTPTPVPTPTRAVNVTYQVKCKKNGKLYTFDEVKNLDDYAGEDGYEIVAFRAKVDKGSIEYEAHTNKHGWLGKVTGYNWDDDENGYAGYNNEPITAIRMCYNTPSDIQKSSGWKYANYKVSTVQSDVFYAVQTDDETSNGQDGYAGDLVNAIDKIEIEIH